jgi:ureidoglycolate lyase
VNLRRLRPETLSDAAFRPFGDVIWKNEEAAGDINDGTTRKYADLAAIDTAAQGGRTTLHIYRSRAVSLPLRIEKMERHPLGSQAFLPLHHHPFLVVVAPAAESLDAAAVRAFVTNGDQGINYRKGVWHHYLVNLREGGEYLVIDRGGAGANCDEQRLDEPLLIERGLIPPV